jgi:hypothetical protein
MSYQQRRGIHIAKQNQPANKQKKTKRKPKDTIENMVKSP